MPSESPDDEDERDRDEWQEPTVLRVTVPNRQRLLLHQLKLLTAKDISEAVTEALEAYIEDELDADLEARLPDDLPSRP